MSTTAPTRPTRRTLVRGAAWSVPVVSLAAVAPAFAASCAVTYTMAWSTGTFNRVSSRSATGTAASGSRPAIVLTLSSTSYSNNVINNNATSNNRPDVDRNLSVPPGTDGADGNLDPGVTTLGGRANERGIRLQHASSVIGRGNRQEVTISFSRAVQNLSFFITDIDTITTNTPYADRVELTSSPAVPAGTDPAVNRLQTLDGITGNGVFNDPWLRTANSNVDENNAGAQVRVSFPNNIDINSVTLTYWNNAGGTQYHRIFIGNMSFQVASC